MSSVRRYRRRSREERRHGDEDQAPPDGREEAPLLPRGGGRPASPRDGRFIENIGKYHPLEEPSLIEIDEERALHWLRTGAQPSEQVQNLMNKVGIWEKFAAERPNAAKVNSKDKKVRGGQARGRQGLEEGAGRRPRRPRAAPAAEAGRRARRTSRRPLPPSEAAPDAPAEAAEEATPEA